MRASFALSERAVAAAAGSGLPLQGDTSRTAADPGRSPPDTVPAAPLRSRRDGQRPLPDHETRIRPSPLRFLPPLRSHVCALRLADASPWPKRRPEPVQEIGSPSLDRKVNRGQYASMDFQDALAVLRALEHEGVEYALVGSMAMAAQGLVRATQDMDLFVAPTPDNIARLKRALRAVFNDPCIDEITVEDLAGEYPAVRYVPPTEGVSIDLLARLGDAFSFADIETETMEVAGTRVRVATPRMLVRMKRGTLRPLDHADAAALRARFGIEDE